MNGKRRGDIRIQLVTVFVFARVPKRLWGSSYKAVAVCSTHTSRMSPGRSRIAGNVAVTFCETKENDMGVGWYLALKCRHTARINRTRLSRLKVRTKPFQGLNARFKSGGSHFPT